MPKRIKASWLIFGTLFAAEFAVGFYISYIIGFMHTDALSRVANAFYVLFSRDPHLAAIGFIWNPLPSFLELLVLPFYPFFPALATHGLAGILMSSVFAGLAGSLLYRTCRKFGLGKAMAVTLTALYAFNPFIFLFGFNGLSDAPYIYFLMVTVIQFSLWIKDTRVSHLILGGFALAFAFWCRYEAVPFGFSLALSVLLVIFFRKGLTGRTELSLREKLHQMEATWIILLLPAVFSGLLWIFFNYMIMGDPLYFLNSEYSNTAQSMVLTGQEDFARLFGSPWLSLLFVLRKSAWFAAPLAAVLLIRLIGGRLFRWDTLVILLLFAAVPGLQYLLLMRESTFGWFRYFMYVFPVVVAWLPYELHLSRARFRRLSNGIAMTSLVVTFGLLAYALTNPAITPDEHNFMTLRTGNASFDEIKASRSAAAWMDKHVKDGIILTDSSSAFIIITNSSNYKKFMITSDRDFKESLSDPVGRGVDYILVPRPVNGVMNSTIGTEYPGIYEEGRAWLSLVREFEGGWRLFRVNKQAQDQL